MSDDELLDEASAIAKSEADDLSALISDLNRAAEALGAAFNRLSPQTHPSLCVAQGHVEAAIDSVDAALNLVDATLEVRTKKEL